jgi:hypothetical protein
MYSFDDASKWLDHQVARPKEQDQDCVTNETPVQLRSAICTSVKTLNYTLSGTTLNYVLTAPADVYHEGVGQISRHMEVPPVLRERVPLGNAGIP